MKSYKMLYFCTKSSHKNQMITMKKANHFSKKEFLRHLSLSEVRDVDNSLDLQKNMLELWARLNIIRLLFDKPIIINSWYRDNEHNQRVGGSATSQHLKGQAVDITSTDNTALMNVVRFVNQTWGLDFGQIIQYGSTDIRFIHLSLPTERYHNQYTINK